MKVYNKTTRKQIAKDCKVCSTLFSKTIGLMFKRSVKKPLIFIFPSEKKVSLHMFFVFCQIDVVWLDKNKKVVQIKENLMPFSTVTGKTQAQYILELPKGSIHRSAASIGNTVELI